MEHFLCGARVQAEPHTGNLATTYDTHPKNPDPNTPAVAASSQPPRPLGIRHQGPARSGRHGDAHPVRASHGAGARTSTRPWLTSTERKTMSTCSCRTPRRWRCPTWSTPSRASHPGGYVRSSSAGPTGLPCIAGSGPRRTSPGLVVARHSASSRTTSQIRNDQTRQGFLPALKDGVSTPDTR